MKPIKFITGLLLLMVMSMDAQVNINVNVGAPAWGPAGYSNVNYYYLPDIQSYYDVPNRQFIYLHSGSWKRAPKLPHHHRHYNLYKGYKVVLTDYHGHRPHDHFKHHKVKYHKGYRGILNKKTAIKRDHKPNVFKGKVHHNGKGHHQGKGHGRGKGHGKH